MGWQTEFTLQRRSKGCHLVTEEVLASLCKIKHNTQVGMLFLFIKHTSCSLTVNENFDPDVRKDMDMALDRLVPESLPWLHTDEGPDDSVSHTKATLVGSSISIPITNSRLNLGTWQGIYLTEFRRMEHSRKVVATILS
ncbi:hypothetical protein B0H16DRAFT_29820 [Mycena metata]|uniref:Secondary thiamine-phosphate synthase enzyme n=1 Tax=Mycena metata TaxID=1033252 RepID=A0AAD7P3L8_9AGAR|nr:hypothetical protein B0H16DRAFT_29820 [Mycena metata]